MICLYCGNEFDGRKRKYCTKKCRDSARYTKRKNEYKKQCVLCLKKFTTANERQIFCSPKCRGKDRRTNKGIMISCIECGKQFERTNKGRKYCSMKCAGFHNNKERKVYLNQEDRLEARRQREKKRNIEDPLFSIKNRMRYRIYIALKHGKNGKKWQDMFGYTIDDLRRHLQGQFKQGMTWKRFLKGDIHIDHIIPISAFNFNSTRNLDFKKCWALSNLQPMWAIDNIKKNAKLERPFQPSLLLSI